jgi:L-threonylcarbamoyladenylate synthase
MIFPATRDTIQEAAKLLRAGGVVGVPTETVYGLAGCINAPSAIAEIFRLKGRPQDNPLIVHVVDHEQACELTTDQGIDALTLFGAKFWPGPLTIVVPCSDTVPHAVTAGLDTVAMRMPSHPVLRELIRETGSPLAAPSANMSGRPSPTRAEHVRHDIGDSLFILDGGPCEHGIESTVVKVVGTTIYVLRPGALSLEQLLNVGDYEVAAWKSTQDAAPVAPGMKYRHYAPAARLELCSSIEEVDEIVRSSTQRTLVLAPHNQIARVHSENVHTLETSTLFDELRQADVLQTALIVVLCDESVRANEALMNRLTKAAGIDEKGL